MLLFVVVLVVVFGSSYVFLWVFFNGFVVDGFSNTC